MPTTTTSSPVSLLAALERLPARVRVLGHTTRAEQRDHATTGTGGTLYARERLREAVRDWSRTSPRLRAARWQVRRVDGRLALVDVRAPAGSPPEISEPRPGQAFACDATG